MTLLSSICIVLLGVTLRSIKGQPLPPDLLPGGSPLGTCVDIVFLYDISCSIRKEDMMRSVEFTREVLNRLDIRSMLDNTGSRQSETRIAAALYASNLHHVIYLTDFTADKNEILGALDLVKEAIETAVVDCDTKTNKGIEALISTYFTEEYDRREEAFNGEEKYPNVAVIFTDARTKPMKHTKFLVADMDNAKAAGIDILLVLLLNKFQKDGEYRPPTDTKILTGGDIDKRYDIRGGLDDINEATELADYLNMNYQCALPNDDFLLCADIIFAYDVSCSVTPETKVLMKYVMQKTYKMITSGEVGGLAEITVSAIAFDQTARTQFNVTDGVESITESLENLDMMVDECRTLTENVFSEAQVLVNDAANREKAPNYLIMFYDGLTAPLQKQNKTIEAAREFREPADTEIIMIRLDNNRNKDGTLEFEQIPSFSGNEDVFFDLPNDRSKGNFLNEENKDQIVLELLSQLERSLCEVP